MPARISAGHSRVTFGPERFELPTLGFVGWTDSIVVCKPGAVAHPSRDAELLAPEFRPMDSGALGDQEPYTAWLRRGISRDRIFAQPKRYEPVGTGEAVRVREAPPCRRKMNQSRRTPI